MANDTLSDEDYLDSLLKKITSSEDETEKTKISKIITDDAVSEEGKDTDTDSIIQELLKNNPETSAEESKPIDSLSFETLKRNTSQTEEGLGLDSDKNEKMPEESDDFLNSLDSIVKEVQDETQEVTKPEKQSADETKQTEESENQEIEELDSSLNIADDFKLEETEKKEKEEIKEKPEKQQKKKRQKKVFKKEINVENIKGQKSFWEKIKDIFFKVEVVEEDEEGLTENERVLKELEKEKKKNKKEEASAKKEASKKQREEKKQENDKKKQSVKEQKQKNKQVKKEKLAEKKAQREPVERVKIKPVFLIFMLTIIAAFVMAVMFSSNALAYNNNISTAAKYLERQKYELAYNELSGLKIKEEDKALYEQTRILMLIEKQYNSYINFINLNMPKQALDSLAKAAAQYDKNIDKLTELGITENANQILENVTYALQTEFQMSLEQIRSINSIEDKNEYTRQIENYTLGK